MVDNSRKTPKDTIVATLEEILAELDDQQYFLPALKIVEALEILDSHEELDRPGDP